MLDRIMKDAHEDLYTKVTVRRAFELSLNTGISLAVTKAYGKEPKKFIEGLKRFHLNNTPRRRPANQYPRYAGLERRDGAA